MFHAYKDYVSRETYVPQPDVPRGTKLMLLITNVLACVTPVEHFNVEGLFPIVPGGSTIQLVTSANHLVDVKEMVHAFYGKIHAVVRQISELVWIIFHDRADSGDYFPRCFITNICQ